MRQLRSLGEGVVEREDCANTLNGQTSLTETFLWAFSHILSVAHVLYHTTRGVEFVDEPHFIAKMPDHELWMTFFKDTEGNTLALMAEKRI